MSLLDDVSIVVTPNAYKAGTLYGVLPVPIEGSELVSNGNFANSGNWGGSFSIAGGQLTKTASGLAFQTGVITSGKKYKIVVDVASLDGATNIYAGGNNSENLTVGVQTIFMTGGSQNDFIGLNNGFTSSSGSVFNSISVKEFTASDMDVTRATAATRVDENGLVNYAHVEGSEIVTNGDFATDSNWAKGANTTISGGKLNSNSAGVYVIASQVPSPVILPNKVYKYSVEYTITSGSVRLGDSHAVWEGSLQSSSGTYTNIVTSSSSANGQIYITSPSSDFVGSVDNVSIIETDLNNVPRIDYTGGGCPHILAEPQRTNLVTYSEDFQNYFNVTEITLNSNYAISPDGTTNANKINFPSSSNSMYKSGLSLSGTHTVSFYVKGEGANIGKTFDVRLQGTSVNQNLDVTITGEWVRFEAQTDGLSVFELTNRSSTTIGSGSLILFGFQIEAGSYSTSYIPTSGSTVTRNKDQFTRDGISSLINDTEGVFFAEFSVFDILTNSKVISLVKSSAPSSNAVLLYYNGNRIAFDIYSSSATVSVTTNITNALQLNKVALKYKSGDIALWFNGVEIVTNTNTISLSGLDKLEFDYVSGNDFYGKVKQLQVYKTALTDAQLTSLTS